MKNWVTELKENAGNDVFIMIAGNKCDMIDENSDVTEVDFDTVKSYAAVISKNIKNLLFLEH